MQGDGAHQEGIFQVAEVFVQGVLAHPHGLRAQGVVLLLHREPAAGVGQQLPLQPAQRQRIGYPVPLDHVAQHHHVDVAGQQRRPVSRRGALRLGKAAFDQIAPQPLLQRRCRRPRLRQRRGGLGAGVAQRLAEAERMDQHLHRPAAQAGGDLPAQQAGGGAGDEHLHAAAVDQPAHQSLPAGNVLHLVEIQRDRGASVPLRETAGVFFQQPAEVGDGNAGQPLVLEQEQQLRLGGSAGAHAAGALVGEKRGLAAPPNADDGKRLTGDRRQPRVPAGKPRRRQGQRLGELGA